MNDSIELKLVTEDETECLHRLQVEAFMPLYEKYQDDDTSPAKESLKRVTEKIIEENSDFLLHCVSWRKSWRCESQMASRQKGA